MDKNRIEGVAKQVKGSVKEAIGKITGDTQTELEGAAEKNIGKAQAKAGELADKVRDKLDK
ncbi:MAG: CsbD family protein [Lysobacter sp.]